MNRIYRLVWSRSRRAVVVASELARRNGARDGATLSRRTSALLSALCIALASVLPPLGGATNYGPGGITSTPGGNCVSSGVGPDGLTYGVAADPIAGSGTYANVIGCGASAAGQTGVQVMGAYATGNGAAAVAIGFAAVSSTRGTALGMDAFANGLNATAVGAWSSAAGDGSVAIGGSSSTNTRAAGASAVGANSVAVGPTAAALQSGGVALGSAAAANAANALALGASATAGEANAVALGNASVTAAPVATATATVAGTSYNFAGTSPGSTVSIGAAGSERTLTNLAAGRLTTSSTDAVNGSQLNATNQAVTDLDTRTDTLGANVASNFGGGSTYDPATGAVSAPSYSVGGTTVNNVGDALTNLDGRTTQNTTAIANITNGGGIKYFRANSTLADATAGGTNAVAAGPLANAAGASAVAVGNDADALSSDSVAIGRAAVAGVAGGTSGETAVGTTATATANQSSAFGSASQATGVGATALGNAANAAQAGAVALGNNSVTAAAVATASGTIAGTSYNYAGTAPTSTVSIGTVGGERTLTNVAAGRVSTTSTDAINGSQLNATNQAVTDLDTRTDTLGSNVASSLGGGSAYDPATGAVSAPSYSVGGTTYNNVGGAIDGTNSRIDALNNGAGIKYFHATSTLADSTAIGTNSIAVGPQANAASDDSVAMGRGAVAGTAADASTDPATPARTGATAIGTLASATGSNSTAIGNGATAAQDGAVALGNGSVTAAAVATASGTIAGTSYNYAGTAPASTVSIGTVGGERTLTNVAAGRVSATSTDAINGSQLNATNQAVTDLDTRTDTLGSNVASSLGGGSAYDPATGAVSAPSYSVGGTTYNNVGGAIDGTNSRIDALNNGAGIKYFHATSTLADSTAIGTNSIAVGPQANAASDDSVAMGRGAVAGTAADASTDPATPARTGATAIGTLASATGSNSTAIGNGATAAQDGAVALGNGSTTAAVVATASGTIAGTSYNYAGTAPTSTVSIGTVGGERTLTNVAAGRVSATSTDAINGSQLNATNTELTALDTRTDTLGSNVASSLGGGSAYDPASGTVSAPSYSVGGTTVSNVGDALTNLDGRTTQNSTDIDNLESAIGNGTVGLVQQQSTSRNITVGVDTDGTVVDFTGTAGSRRLTGVSAGTVGATSTDAINGSQLYATSQSIGNALGGGSTVNADGTVSAPAYSVGGTTYNTVGGAIDGTNSRIDALNNGAGIKYFHATSTLADSTAIGTNSIAVGPQANAASDDSVAMGRGAVAGTAADATTTPATPARTGATAIGTLASATGSNATAIGNGATATQDGAVALGNGSVTAAAVATASGTIAGTSYNYAGTAPTSTVSIGTVGGERTLTNVAAGRVSATSTDAINGSQLNATNTELTALDTRTDTLGSNVASSLGGGSTYNPATGAVSAPSYNVGGTTYNNVGDAINVLGAGGAASKYFHANSTLADSTAVGTDSIAVGPQANALSHDSIAIGRGAVAGVAGGASGETAVGTTASATADQASAFGYASQASAVGATALGNAANAAQAGAVALGTNSVTAAAVATVSGMVAGTTYNYAGTAPASTVSIGAAGAERTLTNVAAGRVSATSTDAINGSQLNATNLAVTDLDTRTDTLGANVASNLGGGATYDPATGTVSAPSYSVGGTTYNNVGGAMTNLDGRVTGNTAAISALGDQVNNGSIGLVRQDATTREITVAAASDGNRVNLAGTAGDRTLAGVADGALSDTSNEAVNGSQLYATNQNLLGLANTVNAINGGGGIKYFRATSSGPDATASGADSVAVGPAATASQANAVAIGNGATATHADSVALGAGSQTTTGAQAGYQAAYVGSRDSSGEVNVGNRTISGVSAGSLGTDAVNVEQLQAGVASANAYTDNRIAQIGNAPVNVERLQQGHDGMFQVNQANGVDPAARGTNSVAAGSGAVAAGAGSMAVGTNASTPGSDAVAIGTQAVASGSNSVALGAGSVADGDNTVAVGSSGSERSITHVAAGTADTDAVNVSQLREVQAGSISYDRRPDGGVDPQSLTLNPGGAPTTIHNVGPGVAPTDAVNLGQLQQVANGLHDDMWEMRRDLRGGTASAMAMAGMPQANGAGRHMLAVGMGGYQGEVGMAVGMSGVSDNGRYIYKAQVSSNTTSDFGFAVGAGLQW